MHVDPLVFLCGKPALDLLEIGEIVDLAEIRELLLRAHAQRVDLRERAAERAVLVHHGRAVPGHIGLVDRHRLEYLDMISEQREVGKHIDVDRLRGGEIENLFCSGTETAAQVLGVIFGPWRGTFHRP